METVAGRRFRGAELPGELYCFFHYASRLMGEVIVSFGVRVVSNEWQQLVRPHRRYIAEENFCIAGKPNQQLWLYLLNDLLVRGGRKC